MTQARFKRLFIVLLGPLLILGAIAGYKNSYGSDRGLVSIICEKSSGGEYCVAEQGEGSEYLADPEEGSFQVIARPQDEDMVITADARTVRGEVVKIGSAYKASLDGYYTPGDELGPDMTFILSSTPQYTGYNEVICLHLDITKAASGIFIASGCSNPAVGVLEGVEFRVQGDDKLILDSLVNAVLEETSAEDARRLGQFVLITPIFALLFLAGSGIVWLFLRGRAYVLAA